MLAPVKPRGYDRRPGRNAALVALDVLWFAPFVGTTAGVPVSYESRGRQYVAMMIASHGGGAAPGADATPASGMIAFALKSR